VPWEIYIIRSQEKNSNLNLDLNLGPPEYHIHVKGDVSSLMVNKWQIVSRPHRLAKVASVSRGRFEHELA
jgi:hypothetical protein